MKVQEARYRGSIAPILASLPLEWHASVGWTDMHGVGYMQAAEEDWKKIA